VPRQCRGRTVEPVATPGHQEGERPRKLNLLKQLL
jgi:hypothetical protein